MKKQYLTALAAASALAVSLTGCSGSSLDGTSEGEPSTTPSAVAQVERDYQGTLPEVTGEFGKSATISPGTGEEPTNIVAKTLKQGNGKTVGKDDFIAIHYHGALWDGTVFDSSFSKDDKVESVPVAFNLNGLISGWKQGLAGQHVGDRVELIVPSEWGYGEQGQGAIPGGATLVFVIDIVDTTSVDDLSALTGATRTDATLPEGITVEGELGERPTITVAEGTELPSEYDHLTLAEGAGEKIGKDDFLIFHSSGAKPGGETQSSWDVQQPTVQLVGDTPGITGETIGSRVLLWGLEHAYVMDLVGVLHSKLPETK